ncbi:MAG: hypothetical protein WGN25_08575 [Candidatus Electrothrix sp. GW3-4]|uniref:hypothetical protein n=1 Tax=Candidatus Electrothrix sp. GW3-4 TaxID=3126740 RepID=UPI0030CD4D98
MNNHKPLSFQLSTSSYGYVRAIPLLLANEVNSELERWFQNYKLLFTAINNLKESDFQKHLQLEYTYTRRTLPVRKYDQIVSDVTTESDLLNYHQLIKIIHKYIELSYRIYKSLKEKKIGTNITDFEKHIDQICLKFHRSNFPNKLNTIYADLKLTDNLGYLEQINRVRNCLEHRSGIVSEKDCDENKNYMSIKFRYPKISTPSGEFSPTSDIKGKQNHSIIFEDEVIKFRLNQKINFGFDENTKLLFSINICFKYIIDGIYDLMKVDQTQTETIIREIK